MEGLQYNSTADKDTLAEALGLTSVNLQHLMLTLKQDLLGRVKQL